jgi:hypothetical protein
VKALLLSFVILGACSADGDSEPIIEDPVTVCETTLEDGVLAGLAIKTGLIGKIEMQPGTSRQLSLVITECCYVETPIEACVTWSVDGAGATISSTGRLTIDASVESGTSMTVRADIENGRKTLSTAVYVYVPESNPFVGYWSEKTQISCDDETEEVPNNPIGELRFDADGSISVTWRPFEIYYDYWGSYSYDLKANTFSFFAGIGNYVPDDLDTSGTFSFDDGDLILRDVFLGSSSPNSGPAPACGHRFR